MSQFKEVLSIEKKYEHIISKAQEKFENSLNEFKSELAMKDEVKREDVKTQLESDIKRDKKNLKLEGEKTLTIANDTANKITKNSPVEKAVKYLVGEFKNV